MIIIMIVCFHLQYIKECSDYDGWTLITQPEVEFKYNFIGVDLPEGKNVKTHYAHNTTI